MEHLTRVLVLWCLWIYHKGSITIFDYFRLMFRFSARMLCQPFEHTECLKCKTEHCDYDYDFYDQTGFAPPDADVVMVT